MISKNQISIHIDQYEQLYPQEVAVCNSFRHALDACSDNFLNRDNFTPGHVTASCFVTTPKIKNAYTVLIYHKTLQRWLQPGGHLEHSDESLEMAARRELLEETGLTSKLECMGLIDLDIHTIPAKGHQPAHKHFDMRFLFISDKTTLNAGSDVTKAKWTSVAKITPSNSDASIVRALEKATKLLK